MQADSTVLPGIAMDTMVLLVEQLLVLVRQIQALNRRKDRLQLNQP
jgi:hypothetical protein